MQKADFDFKTILAFICNVDRFANILGYMYVSSM